MAEDSSPSPTITDPSAAPTVTVRVRYDTTEVSYASQFIVTAGAEEIVVGMSPGFVTDPNSKENLLPIHSRIAMTPSGAKRLVQALANALKGLEKNAAPGAAGTPPREAGLPKLDS